MKKYMLQFLSLMLIFQLSFSSIGTNVIAVGENTNLEESPIEPTETTIENTEEPEQQQPATPSELEEPAVESEVEKSTLPKANNEEQTDTVNEENKQVETSSNDTEANGKKEKEEAIEEQQDNKPLVQKQKQAKVTKEPVVKKQMVIATAVSENIISNVQFFDGNGVNISDIPTMQPGDAIKVTMDWNLEDDHNYKDGDTFTFYLPEQILIGGSPNGDLIDPSTNINYGVYTVATDGEVVFTFNENIELYSQVGGRFELESVLREDLSGPVEQELVVDVPEGVDPSQEVTIIPTKGKPLSKSGVLDKPKDPTKVTWTIDVNKTLDLAGPIVVSDVVPAGLELITSSIKVYELNMNIDGSSSLGAPLAGPFTSFPIELTDGTKAYRIVFDTKILEKTNTTYVNEATLTSGGKTIEAEASVSTTYSKPMAKSVGDYNATTKEIDWTVNFNQQGNEIKKEDAYFLDYFTTKMAVVPTSIVVEALSYDNDGNEVWTLVPASEYTVTVNSSELPENQNGFKFQFNQDINQAYRINYKTKLTGDLILNQTLSNTVVGLGQKPITVNKKVNNTFIEKKHGTINYEDRTIPWTLTINEDAKVLEGVTITEYFTNKGLLLVSDSVTVENMAGEKILYKPISSSDEGFKIELDEVINEKVIIKYKTTFDGTMTKNGKNTFSNKVLLEGKINGKDVFGIDEDSVTPGEKSQNNGYKSGDYDYAEKVFTWKIGVNYNKEKVSKLVVTDSSPEGLVADLDSIEIYKLDLSGGGEGVHVGAPITNVAKKVVDVGGEPGFEITFNEPIEDAYQIVYEARDEDGVIEGEYNNIAKVEGTKKPSELTAKVPVTHGGELAVKSGEQEGDLINWSVRFNFSQSTLTDATLVDQPSANQFVLADSFHVYKAIPTTEGKFTKGEELSPTLYSVTIAEDGSFKLEFKEEIDEGYYIEYQSYINAPTGEIVENIAWTEALQASSKEKPTSEKVKVVLTNSSASGSGETGSITLYKVDTYNPEKFLPGTEFKLWTLDQDDNKLFDLKTVVTDEEGKVVFDKLLYKNYLIEETAATEGYKIFLSGEEQVEINATYKNPERTIENAPENPLGQLALTKVNAEDETLFLEGAVFNLLDSEGNIVLENLVTNSEGKIEVDVPLNIEVDENGDPISLSNDFTLIETAAPEGYELTEEEWSVTISYEELTEITITNEEIPEPVGQLVITKVSAEDETLFLPGAEFVLLDKKRDAVLSNLVTNNEGKIEVDVPLDIELDEMGNPISLSNDFELLEVSAPDGYQISEYPLPVTITLGEVTALTIENSPFPGEAFGQLAITKVSAEDETLVLPGAKFNVLDAQGNIVLEGLETNSEGMIEVDVSLENNLEGRRLPPMPYEKEFTIVETEAPEGYVRSEETWQVLIDKEELTEITIKNEKKPDTPNKPVTPVDTKTPTPKVDNELPQTSSVNTLWMVVGGLVVLVLGIAFFNRSRKMKTE